ncbi:hypothetical protein ACSMXN_17115 [Jatrophihabitans sp. DSM 45814]
MTLASRAEALFVSSLQPSDQPSAREVVVAIRRTRRTHGGVAGCSVDFAAEYGEHPEEAAERMRWALSLAESLAESLADMAAAA